MNPVRIGYIGVGDISVRMHLPSLAEIPDAELVAICDLDPAKLASVGDRYSVARRYADYREMLRFERLDAVYVVLLPGPTQIEIALAVMEARLPLFVEKPLGTSLADAERLAEAAERTGVKTLVAFNRRFSHVLVAAKETMRARGPLSEVVAAYHKNQLQTGPYWGIKSIVTTDVVHAIDTLRWLAGEPTEILSFHDRFGTDWVNVHNALMRFDSGAVGILSANRAAGSRYERFEMHGVGISAYVRAPERAEIFVDGVPEPTVLDGAELAGTDDRRVSYGYAAESRHFVDCVTFDRTPSPSILDALKTMRVVDVLNRRAERAVDHPDWRAS